MEEVSVRKALGGSAILIGVACVIPAFAWVQAPSEETGYYYMYDDKSDPPFISPELPPMPEPPYSDYSIWEKPGSVRCPPYNDRPYRYVIPDSFWLYGIWYGPGEIMYISSDGWLSFDPFSYPDGFYAPPNTIPPIPNENAPNVLLSVLWNDYYPGGPEPSWRYVYFYYDTVANSLFVEWHNMASGETPAFRYEFMAIMQFGGKELLEEIAGGEMLSTHFIHFIYHNTTAESWETENPATGIEDVSGTKGIYYQGTIETETDSFHVIRIGYKGPKTYIEEPVPLPSTEMEVSYIANRDVGISFTLSNPSRVMLKVFDASGRLINTLINDNLEAGNHTVNWNIIDVPKGVYFVTLLEKRGNHVQKVVIN